MPELAEYRPWAGFTAVVGRDLTALWRNRSDIASPLVFFLISITLLPLGVDPSAELLATIAPGMIWIMALLATLLSLDTLFRQDYADGSLTQFILSPQPLYLTVLAKVLVHWLTTGLPLALIAPLLGGMLSLPTGGYGPLVVSLLIGTAAMSLIGALGAALTVCLRTSALVLTLIIMPLYLPVLIIGANTVSSAVAGFATAQGVALLGAILALTLIVMPLAAAGALKISTHH